MPRERRRRAGTEISRDREATRLHSPLETPFTEEEAAREAARPHRSHSGQIAVSDPVIPGASLDPLGQHPGACGPLDRSGGGLAKPDQAAGRNPGPRQTPPRPCFWFCKYHRPCSLEDRESGPCPHDHAVPSVPTSGRSFPCASPTPKRLNA